MKDNLKDIYENIKDRLSNPLIFSFLCAWLIYNWKIPVALLWYDKSQFSGCGCVTIFEFIEWYWKNEGTFRVPFIISVLYTIFIPFIKNAIRIVSAYAQKWGENEEIKALDGGKIGIEKYLELRDNYKEKIKILEEVAKEEKTYLEENTKLLLEINSEKEKLKQSIQESIDNKEFIDELYDFSILNGNWTYIVEDKQIMGIHIEQELRFNQSDIYEVNEFNSNEKIFEIKHFIYNKKSNKLFFVKQKNIESSVTIPFENMYKINDLYFKDEFTLVGTENGNNVEYKKIIRKTKN